MEAVYEWIAALIAGAAVKFPILIMILSVIGGLRAIFKPGFELLKQFTTFTPWDADDQLLENIQKSKVYEWVAFAIDWLGSIKLPKQQGK